MSFTYGFYNSYKGDRKYNALQVSEIFDGILKDGIIHSIGQHFAVTTANNGMQINVGTGRAWFNHTWSKNDSVMVLNVAPSDVSRDRYDMVVLEVDHNDSVRANAIKVVQGAAAVNPIKPAYITTDKIHQYPLAYILVKAGSETIPADNIENHVGLTPTVFATGVLESTSLDDLWAQWEGQFNTWFSAIKLQLSDNVVTNLQYQIDQLEEQVKEISDSIDIRWVDHSEVFTSNTTWKNDSGKTINAMVTCIGGGGGAQMQGADMANGGGSGYVVRESISIPHGATVNITIGAAGANAYNAGTYVSPQTNGGTTSFGSYLSANGGAAATDTGGGSGGAGGGGAVGGSTGNGYRAYYLPGSGGNGQFGGGGGGSGGFPICDLFIDNNAAPANHTNGGAGGRGGSYGGGGGGGGGAGGYIVDFPYASSVGLDQKYGANGGTSTGNGGSGGKGGNGGDGDSYVPTAASAAGSGVNTTSLQEEFKGTGVAGSPGALNTSPISRNYSNNGGNPDTILTMGRGGPGGGGGGGYGGVGGNGSIGYQGELPSSQSGYGYTAGGGAGGGGGGYGAKGGNAENGYKGNRAPISAGGGGGGYGHDGGNASRGCAGGGGGYGPNNYGCGGGGSNGEPKAGICFMTWTTKEIIVS